MHLLPKPEYFNCPEYSYYPDILGQLISLI